MNNFLKKIGVFLVFPFLIILTSDIYLRNKNSLYKEKFKGALESADQIEVLILGNSHANYGVDPKAFDKYAYNIANVNQSIYFDKRITLKLLDELKNIKFVLISADFHSLYFADQGLRNYWSYQGHRIKYKNKEYFLERLSPSLFGYPPKVVLSYLKRDLKNFLFYNNNAVGFPVQKGVDVLDTIKQGFIGYSNSDLSAFSSANYQKRADVFNQKIYNNKPEREEIQEDLIEFIKVLKNHGIYPILFSTPTFQEYNKYLDRKVIEKNRIFYKNVADIYEISYWDFMDSKVFNKEDFYDEDHLNKDGAKKFGLILNDSIKTLKSN